MLVWCFYLFKTWCVHRMVNCIASGTWDRPRFRGVYVLAIPVIVLIQSFNFVSPESPLDKVRVLFKEFHSHTEKYRAQGQDTSRSSDYVFIGYNRLQHMVCRRKPWWAPVQSKIRITWVFSRRMVLISKLINGISSRALRGGDYGCPLALLLSAHR